jgi:hypothetical protein
MTAQQLLDEQSRMVLSPATESHALPYVGVAVGLEHRFAAPWKMGVGFDYLYATSRYQAMGLTLEASYLRY